MQTRFLSTQKHWLQDVWFLILSFLITDTFSQILNGTARWEATDVWSACSTTCGPGVQHRIHRCVNRDIYDVVTVLPDEKCPPPSQVLGEQVNSTHPLERPCNFGSCRGYHWRVSNWSQCSQICGGFGTMSRDLDCVYTGSENDIVLPVNQAAYYCGSYQLPEKVSSCNQFACPPEFIPEPWGKCTQSDPCRPGRQVRQISCISVQVNGTRRYLPRAACYRMRRPMLLTWRRCFSESIQICTDQAPTIDTDSITIVQMRKAKVINLKVGQQAYVIPYTRVAISCPVHYFPSHDIVWQHKNHEAIRYTGSSPSRVSVDKRGKLRIRSYRLQDDGAWQCQAGNRTATINVSSRTPAAGFHDWIQRNRLWSRGMLSDDPKDLAAAHAIVQWVEGPWSACSVSCGDSGSQYRVVRCERVDTRFYEILDEKACLDKLLPKPTSRRKCLKSRKCPGWRIDGAEHSVCTDRCLDVGQGSIKGDLKCYVGSHRVEEKLCDSSEKPDMSCPNAICQLNWNVSQWSRCSRSCGGVGVRARQLLCVWAHNGETAGPHCYANQIPVPEVIEQCEAPPCKLDCIDFSSYCSKDLDLCKYTLYRYQCCASCKRYASKFMTLPAVL